MRRRLIICIFFLSILPVLFSNDIYQHYILTYGEGPLGQHLLGFESVIYSKQDAVDYAKSEIMEFLSAMIYGYTFTYKVENTVSNIEGYFDLEKIADMQHTDPNITLRQLEEKSDAIRIQATYRLGEDQKHYIRAYQSLSACMSMGEAEGPIIDKWESRLDVYKEAIKAAVLNEARNRLKSRPLLIKGRLLLQESPRIYLISGNWRVRVTIHLMIQDVEYRDVY